jgi:hypothetical protein
MKKLISLLLVLGLVTVFFKEGLVAVCIKVPTLKNSPIEVFKFG